MTNQELIEYRCSNYILNQNNLSDYILAKAKIDTKTNYQSKWKLDNDRLYIVSCEIANLQLNDIFGNNEELMASWFTGAINFTILSEENYDKCLWINIKEGIVFEKKIILSFSDDFQIDFGKYKGRCISDIIKNKDYSYLNWAIKNVNNLRIPPHILSEINLDEDVKSINIWKFLDRYNVSYNIYTHIYDLKIYNDTLYNNYGYYLNEDFDEDFIREYGQNIENEKRDNDNYERDYFNTMTDGQFGEYDNFNGNIDDIDNWSRG